MLAFVEGALVKTAPGMAFTSSVVAALPLLAATAKSATAGATAAKSGTAIKILFMTKTTQAIIVAAATTAVILTPPNRVASLPQSNLNAREPAESNAVDSATGRGSHASRHRLF